MVVFVFAAEDLGTAAAMDALYRTRRNLVKLLQLDMTVVLASDGTRWNQDIHNIRLALLAVKAPVLLVSDYLKDINDPPAARAASPASHVAVGGQPIA